MVSFPLLLIPLAIYNIIVFLMPGVSLEQPVVKVILPGSEKLVGEMLFGSYAGCKCTGVALDRTRAAISCASAGGTAPRGTTAN